MGPVLEPPPLYKRGHLPSCKSIPLSKLLSKHSLDGCKCMYALGLERGMHLSAKLCLAYKCMFPRDQEASQEGKVPSSKWGRSPPPPPPPPPLVQKSGHLPSCKRGSAPLGPLGLLGTYTWPTLTKLAKPILVAWMQDKCMLPRGLWPLGSIHLYAKLHLQAPLASACCQEGKMH